MWTMQRDGDYVYVFSVRSGRQPGPMMLQRVHWQNILNKTAYEGWGYNGQDWAWGRPCTAILSGDFGEPSVRKLSDGTWVMCYMNTIAGTIVTRTAKAPDQPWTPEVIQVSAIQEPAMYGGFIHPWSQQGAGRLHIFVSQLITASVYHVSQFVGTL